MPIYAYADETVFDIDKLTENSGIGYGVFVSKTPIESSLIDDALRNLQADPNHDTRYDPITLSKGCFHASADSAHAHSHLCRAITKNLRGFFDFSYHSVSSDEIKKKSDQSERFLSKCLSHSSLEFFNSMEEVHLVIEGRAELRAHHIAKWKEKIYDLLEGAAYYGPYYKTFFPKIDVVIGTKATPGLQVADFMAWATARSIKQPKDDTWFSRIGFHFTSFSKSDGPRNGGMTCYLNEKPDTWMCDYPNRFSKSETTNDIIAGYVLIERFFWHVDASDFNDQTTHLFADFEKASRLCKSMTHLVNENFAFIARVFIRLFDSLPLYAQIADSDSESWKCLFHAKEMATLLITQGFMHTSRTVDSIQRWRYQILTHDKAQFLELMEVA